MKDIFKVLKKYIFHILIVILLLISQAFCDLKLPEFTSYIVNVGIQQNGVDSPVFETVREDVLLNILSFTNSSDREKILSSYTKNKENLYILKDDVNKEDISLILEKPIIYYNFLVSVDEENFVNIKKQLDNASDIEKQVILDNMDKELDNYEDSMIRQMAIKFVIDEYKENGVNIGKIQNRYIFVTGLKMLGLAVLIMVITIGTIFLSSRIAAGFSNKLRNRIFNRVMQFSNEEFEKFQTSSLITRTTNDVFQIQNFIIMSLRMVFYAPIVGIGAYLKVSGNEMSWVIGLCVAIVLVIMTSLFSIVLPKFQVIQNLIDKLNLVVREQLTGLPVIRAFGTEKYEENRFDKANKDVTNIYLFVNRIMVLMMPLMMFIMNGASILIIWVGAKKVDAGSIQVGTLIALITYTIQIIMSFIMVSMLSVLIPRSVISFKRIADIFRSNIAIKDGTKEEKLDNIKGLVEFKDVSFRYPDAKEEVVSNVSFIAKPGTTTAIIGGTGSGKSTLINLLPRFYDVTNGEILIDGVNIKDVKLKDLRNTIGYVPQKGILFKGTIKSNILLGNEKLDKKELEKVAKVSQSLDFILDKKDGFDSEISQGGSNVSGGQRQRLSIARAIAKNPKIYIFDDSFSALDFKTDFALRKALNEYTKDSTIFIVAQRISTILNADQIIVLDKGKVVGIGNHKTLLRNCDVYKEIALSQLKEDELDA